MKFHKSNVHHSLLAHSKHRKNKEKQWSFQTTQNVFKIHSHALEASLLIIWEDKTPKTNSSIENRLSSKHEEEY